MLLQQQQACHVQDYCGLLSEEAVRKNVLLVYELLDEVIDYGFPQNSSSEALKEFVLNDPTVLRPVRNTVLCSGFAGLFLCQRVSLTALEFLMRCRGISCQNALSRKGPSKRCPVEKSCQLQASPVENIHGSAYFLHHNFLCEGDFCPCLPDILAVVRTAEQGVTAAAHNRQGPHRRDQVDPGHQSHRRGPQGRDLCGHCGEDLLHLQLQRLCADFAS